MRPTFRSRPAESMIETLISIMVIVLGTMAGLSMIRTAVSGNEVIGEKLIAIELAMEGLDAVKNVRDTNYLLFASDTENCWNRLGITDVSDCLDAPTINNSIYGGNTYYLTQDFSSDPLFKWTLTDDRGANPGRMNLFQVDTGSGETAALYADWHSASYTGFSTLVSGLFTRTIAIDYDPLDSSGADQCPNNDCFSATVTVEWTIKDSTKSLSLTRIFSNVY